MEDSANKEVKFLDSLSVSELKRTNDKINLINSNIGNGSKQYPQDEFNESMEDDGVPGCAQQ